jgi:4-amino-4-deoxy-L-arabinose transferase-like glycosyltransferase
MRPYIGGSQDNSFLSVTFGYNGLGRISGNETGSVGGGHGWGTTGLGRMFSYSIGGQISWLIPSAFILLAVGLFLRGRAPRTDARRAAYVVWGGWLLVTMVTFSLMAGIFHEYYTVALAPAIAALVGMGAAEGWEHRAKPIGSITLSAATAAAATWSFILLSRTDWQNWLRIAVLVLGLASALLLLAITLLHRRFVPVVIAGALVAALAGPAAYSVQTVGTAHTGSIVTAGPASAGGGPGGGGMPGGGRGTMGAPPQQGTGGTTGGTTGGLQQGTTGAQGGTRSGGMGGLLDASTPSTEVVSALSADADSYRWVAAAIGSQNAAGLQLGTGLPVMAIGGFNGSDPSPTLAQFQQYVADGDIHYFAEGGGVDGASSGTGGGMGGGPGGGIGGGIGGTGTGAQISAWVAANFTPVTISGSTFYDLTRPLTATDAPDATTQTT